MVEICDGCNVSFNVADLTEVRIPVKEPIGGYFTEELKHYCAGCERCGKPAMTALNPQACTRERGHKGPCLRIAASR